MERKEEQFLNDNLKEAIKRKDKDALINSLSNEDKKKLNSVLGDKKALEEALKSPEAKAIMKAFFGGKNG